MSPQTTALCRIGLVAVCITVIEIVALCKGKNGILLRLTIAVLAGLAGFSVAGLIK
jgi:hypothetical protein